MRLHHLCTLSIGVVTLMTSSAFGQTTYRLKLAGEFFVAAGYPNVAVGDGYEYELVFTDQDIVPDTSPSTTIDSEALSVDGVPDPASTDFAGISSFGAFRIGSESPSYGLITFQAYHLSIQQPTLSDFLGDGSGLQLFAFAIAGAGPVDFSYGSITSFLLEVVDLETEVSIDIKPGSSQNTVNLGSQGVTPVAILSTTDFDATTVDPLTVELADATVRVRGNGTPQASFQDVNGDGLTDLVLHMMTEGFALTADAVDADLTGETFGGDAITGTDSIRVIE